MESMGKFFPFCFFSFAIIEYGKEKDTGKKKNHMTQELCCDVFENLKYSLHVPLFEYEYGCLMK